VNTFVGTVIIYQLVMTTDEVAFFVHMHMLNVRPRAITTQVALDWLDDSHLGVSAQNPEYQKQRLVQVSLTFSGAGMTICTVIKIIDRKFQGSIPILLHPAERLYLLIFNPTCDKKLVSEVMYKGTIIPEMLAERVSLIARDLTPLKDLVQELQENGYALGAGDPAEVVGMEKSISAVAVANGGAVLSEMEVRAKYKLIASVNDGEYNNLDTVMTVLVEYCNSEGMDIGFAKYAAGCSFTQSPNEEKREKRERADMPCADEETIERFKAIVKHNKKVAKEVKAVAKEAKAIARDAAFTERGAAQFKAGHDAPEGLEEQTVKKRQRRVTVYSNCICQCGSFPGHVAEARAAGWVTCAVKDCAKIFCTGSACQLMRVAHEVTPHVPKI
jgi:hypothetical protein